LGRPVSNRNGEKIRVFERPYLRIERAAHQIQPRASDVSVVPDLPWHRQIGECLC
jgi:hypothetical protein